MKEKQNETEKIVMISAIVKYISYHDAAILLVDSNLKREELLSGEKAFAKN